MEGLERMMQGDDFDIAKCMQHLHRHLFDESAMQKLVRKLGDYPLDEVEYYLSQLLGMCLRGPPPASAALRELLRGAASRSMHVAIRIACSLDGEMGDAALAPRVSEIRQKIESSAINGAPTTRSSPNRDQHSPTSAELQRHSMKQSRCLYFNDVCHLIQDLCHLSNGLRELPREQRNGTLAERLRDISDKRLLSMTATLPMGLSSGAPFYRLIRIPPGRHTVFFSRERAPFLVWFEAIETGGTQASPQLPAAPVEECRVAAARPVVEPTLDLRVVSAALKGTAEKAGYSVLAQLVAAQEPGAAPEPVVEHSTEPVSGPQPVWNERFLGMSIPDAKAGLRLTVRRHHETGTVDVCVFELPLLELRNEQGAPLPDGTVREQRLTAPDVTLLVRVMCRRFRKSHTEVADPPQGLSDPSMSCSAFLREDHFSPSPRSGSPSPLPGPLLPGRGVDDNAAVRTRLDRIFGIAFEKQVEEERRKSPYGGHPSWRVLPVIVKGGDDMRQEVLAMQMINCFDSIWREANLPICMGPYSIMVSAEGAGMIELITDSKSIDSIKKTMAENEQTLAKFWSWAYGRPDSHEYQLAQRNFVESMAGYSVVSYLLQLKDRHNANIMLKRDGRVAHIDFGFMLTNSPGGMNIESMPFKLTQEYVDVMGGTNSDMFRYFRVLVYMAFQAARRNSDRIINMVEMMFMKYTEGGQQVLKGPNFPCFGASPRQAIDELRNRFMRRMPDQQFAAWVRDAIDQSVDNWRARNYDRFQRWQNGII
eukprot:TRINITY_DN11539_c0_g1_i1.p1 TRINITY_DN11539_c0_g1~~TRINITY_DN11539_c0_g1_i1.p1  ORF type:complete len:763 (+),score=212.54 TRINITY_DN11539_c0_g1_i1:61-2349(+)